MTDSTPLGKPSSALDPLPTGTVVGMVAQFVANLDGRNLEIVERRLFGNPPATLAELGDEWQISRERVRQLANRIVRRAKAVEVDAVDARLAQLRRGRTTPLGVGELGTLDTMFEGIERRPEWLRGLLENFGSEHRLVDDGDLSFVTHRAGADLSALTRLCHEALQQVDPDGRDEARRRAHVRELLGERGIQELVPVVLERLEAAGRLVRPRTLPERIEHELRRAGEPLTVDQLLAALAPVTMGGLNHGLLRASVVRSGPGTYALREWWSQWLDRLPTVGAEVVAFLECVPSQQWRADHLLSALAEAGAEWARDLPLPAFEVMLYELPEVVDLRRSYWGLATAHTDRRRLLDIAIELLQAAGGPLPRHEVVEGIRAQRSIGAAWRPRYPVAIIAPGQLGLADRDLDLDEGTWQRFTAAIDARLAAGEQVDPHHLADPLNELGGPQLSDDVLFSLVAAEQSLYRRIQRRGEQS